jgi:hypothetical protein
MPPLPRTLPLPSLPLLLAAAVALWPGLVRAEGSVPQPKTAAEAARANAGLPAEAPATPAAAQASAKSDSVKADAAKPDSVKSDSVKSGPGKPEAGKDAAAKDAKAEARPDARTTRGSPDAALPDDFAETPIPVPPVLPTGILIAWKPMLLQLRADNGGRADNIRDQFSSDKLSALRFLVRYTHLFDEKMPFVGRVELEGGEFKSDQQADSASTFNVGSTGIDVTGRLLVGAATRVSPGFTVVGSLGGIIRYQYGKAQGGAPTMGSYGAVANMELEFRVHPVVTLSLFGEAAIAPLPFYVQTNLGELDDSSEIRGRIQLSFDLSRSSAVDFGFDATRWHTILTKTTIAGQSPQALILETRELALTLGLRWVL